MSTNDFVPRLPAITGPLYAHAKIRAARRFTSASGVILVWIATQDCVHTCADVPETRLLY
jgi:hypothetical protein